MYQPIIDRSYLTEVKFTAAPAAGQKWNFPDIPELRPGSKQPNLEITGMECFFATQLTVSPNGNAVVALVTGLVVTFAVGSTEEIFQIPCIDLVPGSNSGLIRMLNKKKINFPKSYVTILDAAGLGINQAVLFNTIYRK